MADNAANATAQLPPKAWGEPLEKLDKSWTALEQRLCIWVIVTEITVLCIWVSLTGLSAFYVPGGGNVAGVVFRGVVGAIVLGVAAHFATRSKPGLVNPIAVTSAVILGLLLGRTWANGGQEYASNLRAWIQNASALMLVGGLRGVVTRLTLWLALLGASIATSRGKHINIDVATRYMPSKLIAPVAIVGWLAAAMVCFAATWGFVDGISVTKFNAEAFRACNEGGKSGLCDTPVSDRLATTKKAMASDLFLLGRQISLDLRTAPRVLAGTKYDQYLKGSDWNAWLKGSYEGWTKHFEKSGVDALVVGPESEGLPKMPAVSAPGASAAGGLLIRDLNFVLPFGLLVIGLKFVLRILLVLSGHVRIDLDSAHADDEAKHIEHAQDPIDAPAAGGAR